MNHSIARGNYDRLSQWYEGFTGPELKYMRIGLKMLDIQAGEKVLEIGCGTGHALIDMAYSSSEKGMVYGIDLSKGMIHKSQRKVSRARLASRINLQIGDAVGLPYKSNCFNAMFMSFTLEIFNSSEIPHILAEIKRVLIPGGRLVVVALEKKNIRAVNIYEWFHFQMPSVVDCCPINLRETLETAMFIPVNSVEKSMWGLPISVMLARKHE
jgi:ubiquinone/menaquinone biosynthesis C-methylase UbiE